MRFDACAHSYDAHAAPQRAFAAQVADFIRMSPKEQALELGAGTGALTGHLCAIAGVTVHATDASPAMVARGRAAVPSAHWAELDAFRSPILMASLQVSSGLLQWADDPVKILQHWGTALAPGGRMVHAFPCEPCLAEWRALVEQGPILWRDESAWLAIFTAAKLRVRRRAFWVKSVSFSSALDMLRALHRSGATSRSHLGPGRLRAALRAYEVRHRRGEEITATWAWLAVEAAAG